jgi:hypothetical protein
MDDRAHNILDQAAHRLLQIPGVHNIAFGHKFVDGRATATLAILVLTLCKRRLADVALRERIPRLFDGMPTDVIEASMPVCYGAQPEGKPAEDYSPELDPTIILKPDDYKTRPLTGGLMISSSSSDSDEHKGTLGCFLTPEGDPNKAYALSCHHVFFFQASSQPAGETIFQPEEDRSTCCAGDYSIGTLVDTKCDDLYDIALVSLKAGMKWSPTVRDQGTISGAYTGTPFDKNASTISSVPRVKVKKFGIVTGETGGEIFATGLVGDTVRPSPIDGKPVVVRTNTKALWVQPRPMAADTKKEVVFATKGDSGSAVLTVKDNQLVGILTGGIRFKMGPRFFGVGFVTPIQVILDRYSGGTPAGAPKLVVATATSETDVRTVPGTARAALPEEVLLDRTQAAVLESQVRQTSAGNLLADLYWTHARDVKNLVNRNRRVATAWHRSGVAFVVGQLLRAYRDPTLRLPSVHGERPLTEIVMAFLSVLSRFGSDVLRADVAHFSALVPDVSGLTFAEIMERLEHRSIQPVA